MGSHSTPQQDLPAATDARPAFVPLRRATRSERTRLFAIGPLLWVGAVIAVAYTVRHGEAVAIALLVLVAAALVAVVTLLPMRARRAREEAER